MQTEESTTECHNLRSLDLAISFLDQYHPAEEHKLKLVNGLRDRIRHERRPQDVLNLAKAIENTPFVLRRGTVRQLPALARRVRNAVGTLDTTGVTTHLTA